MRRFLKRNIAVIFSVLMLFSNSVMVIAVERENDLKVLDLREKKLLRNFETKDDYNVLIVSERELTSENFEFIRENEKPIFIFCQDKEKLSPEMLDHFVYYSNGMSKEKIIDNISDINDCIFEGYYIFNNEIHTWYLHKDANEKMLLEDINNLAIMDLSNNNFPKNTQNRSNLSIIDTYMTQITYTEAFVGISDVLRGENGSDYGANQYTVEVLPRSSSQYYDYSTDSFYLEQDYSVCSGGVISYNPLNKSNVSQITFYYPWAVSATIDLGGRMNIRKVSGGIGSSSIKWKFKPTMFNYTNELTGETVTEFASGTSAKKCHISLTLYVRKTDKRTGSSKVRKYTTGTIVSGN